MSPNRSSRRVAGSYCAEAAHFSAETTLIAYRVSAAPRLRLVPAPAARDWMEAMPERFAARCLPLLIANQSGWLLLNSHPLRVIWAGGDDPASLQIEYVGGAPPYPAGSHFGQGILTWTLPYLFRTSPDYNLLVRGPANRPKDGASPLEGVVETDWTAATFTMNWQLTRPDSPITFDVGEPICMLVPQRRGELEAFRPEIRDIAAEPDARRGYEQWRQSRARFLADLHTPASEAVRQRWQKHYFQGVSPDGSRAPQHQTRLSLRTFTGAD